MGVVRDSLKAVTPGPALRWRQRRILNSTAERYAGASNEEIFSSIYHSEYWGNAPDADFTSGGGSQEARIVEPYVAAVEQFLSGFPEKPDAVDLGCGDFGVGRRIRPGCAGYVACDVVPDVVERNRERHARLDVDFRQLDMAADPLPPGRVVFIRQVLQHLSNADIARVVAKLAQFDYVVITEHLPADPDFVPNLDMPTGPHIRLGLGSGIDVARAPFDLSHLEATVLCTVDLGEAIIRTTVYRTR
jgi:Methyltransferase domain